MTITDLTGHEVRIKGVVDKLAAIAKSMERAPDQGDDEKLANYNLRVRRQRELEWSQVRGYWKWLRYEGVARDGSSLPSWCQTLIARALSSNAEIPAGASPATILSDSTRYQNY